MIHFVGAGPGAPDLITVRGQKLLQEADVIIYAGSLVNPALLDAKKADCAVYNSAHMTLEEVLDVMKKAEAAGKMTVRLHTGDPCLYGAIREQMDALKKMDIVYDICPGVSAFCGAASALELEYTLPGVSQTVIISRTAGRTPVPEKESIPELAKHQATMVLFLSTGHLPKLQKELPVPQRRLFLQWPVQRDLKRIQKRAEPSISVMQAVLQMQREQMCQKAKVPSRLRQPMAVPLEKQVCMKVRK